jgi:hypothetical protein
LIQTFIVYAQDDLTSTSRKEIISTAIHSSPGDAPDVTVEKTINNDTLVKKGPKVLYEGPFSGSAIQIGLDNLVPGQDIYLYNGTYFIYRPLNFSDHIYFHGQGNSTVLDYSDIGNNDAILMSAGSHLANIKVSGSIDPLPMDFTQRVKTNDNTILENVSISKMGYGIETYGSQNVTLTNIKCEFIQSSSDWGACIHGGGGTTDVTVRQFTVSHSNRGIELDANSTNVDVRNGNMFKIRNFNNTEYEAFSLDVHSHAGEGKSGNIYFDSILLEDSYAPSVKLSYANNNNYDYPLRDSPKNVTYQNITLINPLSAWQVSGDGVTVRDSKIINATEGGGMLFYKNSRNIWIDNVTSIAKDVSNQEYHPIQNMTLVNNTIIDGYNKTDPSIYLNQITEHYLVQNDIFNTPSEGSPGSAGAINNLYVCNIHFNHSIDEPCTRHMVEQHKGLGSLVEPANLIKSLANLEYLETLGYDNNSFALEGDENRNRNTTLWRIGNKDDNNTATLYSGNHSREITLWSSNPIQRSKEPVVNYIESEFRVLDSQNKSNDNHAGIVWNDGQKEWYAFLRSHKISMYNSIEKEFAGNPEASRHEGVWYTLRILFLNKSTDVYLNDVLKLQIPRALSDNLGLSKVGIRGDNINAEFKPIKIGRTEID